MRTLLIIFLTICFSSLFSQTGVGIGYNLGYNFGMYGGIDNTVNGNIKYKLVELKLNGGVQQHSKYGVTYKFGCTFGFNKIINERFMFDCLWGVRYITVDGEDPYVNLGEGLGGRISLLRESGIYYRLVKDKGFFLGLNTYLVFSENYTDVFTTQTYPNPNASVFLSITYLFQKKKE